MKAKAKALPERKKIGTKTYTRKACGKTKTEASSAAKKIRSTGQNARVLKNPSGGYCIYVAGKKKKTA